MHVCDLGTRGHCETSAPAFAGDQGMRPAPAADLSGSRPSARQPGAVEVMAGTLTGRPRHDEARARQLPSTRSARRSGRTEVGSSRDVPPRAETLKSCKMCAVDTTPSATCPAQMVCALRDCIHDPINGPTSRGIFGQADAALISCCALGHAAATTFVPRRCDFATPRQLTGVASHLERGGVPRAASMAGRQLRATGETGTIATTDYRRGQRRRAPISNPGSPDGQVGVGPDASDTGTMRTSCRHITKRAYGSPHPSGRHVV
jgi:hypothetical protein